MRFSIDFLSICVSWLLRNARSSVGLFLNFPDSTRTLSVKQGSVTDFLHLFICRLLKEGFTIMVLHLSLPSAVLFTSPKLLKFVQFRISSIKVNLGVPLIGFPQTFPSNIYIYKCEFPLELPYSTFPHVLSEMHHCMHSLQYFVATTLSTILHN